ncbi:acyltransferase-domain-containing protein [Boletus edulis]|nr:acyltransferase-domain-containing protein [Boletus edulis]
MSQLLSSAVISAVGLTCKAFLNSGLCSITVTNLPILLDALRGDRRSSGQGLVTVSNHLSTLDDPLTWGILPFENFTNSRTIRWVLGASDIMFTNPLFSAFFRKGQVIETFRGNGIWQPAVDVAIEKLNHGHWLHMFGEGKVHQPAVYPQVDGIAHLPRFKWGVGRIIMETNVPPLIVPMWLTGFDKLMPERRSFPYKCFPKLGVRLGVTFGDPIPPEKIMDALNALRRLKRPTSPPGALENSMRHSEPSIRSGLYGTSCVGGWMERAIVRVGGEDLLEGPERRAQMDEIRSEVTAITQRAVEDLGKKVSGNTLGLTLPHQSESRDHRVR